MHQWLYKQESGNQNQDYQNRHASIINLCTEESVLNQTRDVSRIMKLTSKEIPEETKGNQNDESLLNGVLVPQKCVSPTYQRLNPISKTPMQARKTAQSQSSGYKLIISDSNSGLESSEKLFDSQLIALVQTDNQQMLQSVKSKKTLLQSTQSNRMSKSIFVQHNRISKFSSELDNTMRYGHSGSIRIETQENEKQALLQSKHATAHVQPFEHQ